MGQPVRTLVIGSCVSRDLFGALPEGEYSLSWYVARQSLISSFSDPVTAVRAPRLPSRFQQRMLNGDVTSNLPRVLRKTAGKVDLILWDLTDERLGVYLFPDDTVVTRTVDLIAAQAEQPIADEALHVEFGTDTHFEMWRSMLPAFQAALARHHPNARLVLVALPWAELTESGEPTPSSFGLEAREANELYQRYYDAAASLDGCTVVGRDADVRSSDGHHWGEAPFHYAAVTNDSLVAQWHVLVESPAHGDESPVNCR